MNLTIGITGAGGYVGSRLCEALTAAGHDVIRFVRRPGANDRFFSLGDLASPDDFEDLDILIHCAWDMQASNVDAVRRTNIEGSLHLLAAARAAGVSRIIFISTMSAYSGCKSVYGQAKLEVETMVRQFRGISIRPGLIYGDNPGGIVGRLLQLAERTPVLPMIGTGNYPLHTCHEDDLCELVLIACMASDRNLPPVITAAEFTGRRFRDIVQTLSRRELRFIPIPWRLAWFGLRGLESVGLRPPIKSDSLIGLVHSNPAPDFSPLQRLGARFRVLQPPEPEKTA
ncbi:MAG: NAD(P)-dependent oxidoreductase [Gammaproteobacteria bacterium]|nr:NAD(P)-dependent oxidoreductase [Gammaproteobacteria bacterium]